MKVGRWFVFLAALEAVTRIGSAVLAADAVIGWKSVLRQEPSWHASSEAVRIADTVLLYQRTSGGWPKNVDMTEFVDGHARNEVVAAKARNDATIDNGATCSQLRYLARVYTATRLERFRDGFLKGLDYLWQAQYENGGWPQCYPAPTGYHAHVTFNDGAMVNVLQLLHAVARKEPPADFIDGAGRERASRAVDLGIECILRCQVIVGGKRTVWCAQHDEKTLQPAGARSYEHPSLSGSESVGIVRFLMRTDQPERRVIESIQSAVAWFQEAKVTGFRLVEKPDPSLAKGYDRVLVSDPSAPPLWARFYELGSNRPLFSGRDGRIRYRLDQIEHERRVGYSWYTGEPAELLEKEYPAWLKRQGLGR